MLEISHLYLESCFKDKLIPIHFRVGSFDNSYFVSFKATQIWKKQKNKKEDHWFELRALNILVFTSICVNKKTNVQRYFFGNNLTNIQRLLSMQYTLDNSNISWPNIWTLVLYIKDKYNTSSENNSISPFIKKDKTLFLSFT